MKSKKGQFFSFKFEIDEEFRQHGDKAYSNVLVAITVDQVGLSSMDFYILNIAHVVSCLWLFEIGDVLPALKCVLSNAINLFCKQVSVPAI